VTIHSVQVQITKIWRPEGTKKNYNLQDSAGVKYNTFPDDADKVREGDMVMLDYEDKEYNGRPFKQTKRLTVTQGGTPMPAPAPIDYAKYQATNAPTPIPRPSNGPPSQDKHIFVTGTVGRAMGSGKFDPQDIRVLTEFACAAWDEFFRT
jgi:hypothetical protein